MAGKDKKAAFEKVVGHASEVLGKYPSVSQIKAVKARSSAVGGYLGRIRKLIESISAAQAPNEKLRNDLYSLRVQVRGFDAGLQVGKIFGGDTVLARFMCTGDCGKKWDSCVDDAVGRDVEPGDDIPIGDFSIISDIAMCDFSYALCLGDCFVNEWGQG